MYEISCIVDHKSDIHEYDRTAQDIAIPLGLSKLLDYFQQHHAFEINQSVSRTGPGYATRLESFREDGDRGQCIKVA
jgi:hypothetical protein